MIRPLRLGAAAAGIAVLLCAAPAWSGSPEVAETLVARRAPSVVLVRLMLRVEVTAQGKSFDQEKAYNAGGTVVDPSGLVLVGMESHAARAAAERMGATIKFVPKNIRVVFGDALDKEYDAVLVARDEVLGFAYLQVLDLGDRKPVAVDLSAGAEPKLGDRVFAVAREDRAYDDVPRVLRGEILQRVEQPRPLWGLSGEASVTGNILYDAAGEPVGVVALQFSSEEDLATEASMKKALRRFLLPLAPVRRSLGEARARVPEAVAAARVAAAEPPAPASAPAPTPAPTPAK